MRHMILTLFMLIAAGVFGFVEGRDWTQSRNVLQVDLIETGQPRVVLANRGTHQQNEARQQWQDCQIPNDSQPKANEQNSSLMKGLVF